MGSWSFLDVLRPFLSLERRTCFPVLKIRRSLVLVELLHVERRRVKILGLDLGSLAVRRPLTELHSQTSQKVS